MRPFVKLKGIGLDFPIERSAIEPGGAGGGRFSGGYKHALLGIDFIARPGDRVGLVGSNGAGKTTLLRLINGVYPPSAGTMVRSGRVVSMINATMGMDLNATGLENVRMRARERGCSKIEVEQVVSDVAEFSELGANMAQPLRTYSAGMRARLSFALATSFSGDIVLMDEWMAAGDARFHSKALGRMDAFLGEDTILFLASHSDGMIRDWCNKVLVLHEGRQIEYGDVFRGLRTKRRVMRGGVEGLAEPDDREMEIAMPQLSAGGGGWCSATGGAADVVGELAANIEVDASSSCAIIRTDFGRLSPKELVRLEPGTVYRLTSEFQQVADATNGRNSGVFLGFILLDEGFKPVEDAFQIERIADCLRVRHGTVLGEFEYVHLPETEAVWARVYLGANYSGGAPHADGCARIGQPRLCKVTKHSSSRAKITVASTAVFRASEGATWTRLTSNVASLADSKKNELPPHFICGLDALEVRGGYGWVALDAIFAADQPLKVRAEASQISDSTNGRPSGFYVGAIGFDADGMRLTAPFRFHIGYEDLRPTDGLVSCDFTVDPEVGVAYWKPYVGVNYSRGAPHSNGIANLYCIEARSIRESD